MRSVDYSKLPEHMREGARLYVENGIEPGGFLMAVLCNDLREAAARADHINRYMLFDWVQWMYCELPSSAWGDERSVDAWIACGGTQGRNGRTMTAEEREIFELRR